MAFPPHLGPIVGGVFLGLATLFAIYILFRFFQQRKERKLAREKEDLEEQAKQGHQLGQAERSQDQNQAADQGAPIVPTVPTLIPGQAAQESVEHKKEDNNKEVNTAEKADNLKPTDRRDIEISSSTASTSSPT
ncbi:hypothetical protein FRB91_006742 [Serendipita sp. 411]|nr:hypothetical protein FRB91_006742 [Serendipita sp. 411]